MTQSPTGGPAQTTHQVASRAGVIGHDAQRVVIVTDGRPAEGGPQQAVYFVSDAEIAAGDFIVTGNKPLPIVQVGASGVEYPPIAVYDVTGKPDDVQPSQNPVAPQFSSAEIGTVNASTVAVTFDLDVSAAGDDYSSGVTIKVNGSTRSFESGIRQANHALVYYALATPVEAGDTVTWEYSAAAGSIVSESDGTALADVTAQSVTNNVAPPDPGIALRADAVAYWTMNEASGTRVDATGRNNDLTPSNAPVRAAGKINGCVVFDAISEQALYRASTADLSLTGSDFTCAFWVNLTAKVYAAIVVKQDLGVYEYILQYNTFSDKFEFYLDNDNGDSVLSPSTPLSAGTWYFVEFWWKQSSGEIGIRVNNGSESALLITGRRDTNTGFSIGAELFNFSNLTFLNYSGFSICEAGIWRRGLTTTERDYLWNSGAGRALFG